MVEGLYEDHLSIPRDIFITPPPPVLSDEQFNIQTAKISAVTGLPYVTGKEPDLRYLSICAKDYGGCAPPQHASANLFCRARGFEGVVADSIFTTVLPNSMEI